MSRERTPGILEFEGSPLLISVDEELKIFLSVENLLDTDGGEEVSSATVKVYDREDDTDKTSTVVDSTTVQTTGVYVTLKDVPAGAHYILECLCETQYNKFENYLMVHGVAFMQAGS